MPSHVTISFTMASQGFFGIVDYVVFAAMLLLSILIGVFYSLAGDRQRTSSEYLYGNRKMSVVPVAISMVVSFISPITLQVKWPSCALILVFFHAFADTVKSAPTLSFKSELKTILFK